MEDPECVDTSRFQSILTQYGLIQHVTTPTHIADGILDIVLTRTNAADKIDINSIQVTPTVTTSDHFLVSFSCDFPYISKTASEKVAFRNLKKINIDELKKDITKSILSNPEVFSNLDEAVHNYNQELQNLFEKHAPLQEKILNTHRSPWWTYECQVARRKRRKAERSRDGSLESNIRFANAYKHASAIINSTRNKFYDDKLQSCQKDPKKTYKVVNRLLDKEFCKNQLPSGKDDVTVATKMGDFFQQKVHKIYSEFDKDKLPYHKSNVDNLPHESFHGKSLSAFQRISKEQLHEVIGSLNKKECVLDPLPVKVMSECIHELTPILLFIVNMSIETGKFPAQLKSAVVRPILKKDNSDSNDLKN